MSIQIRKAVRSRAKGRIAFMGPPGSGKTYTSLMAAFTLGQKVAVIDTERGSSDKYAGRFGEFDIVNLESFSPRNYREAIQELEKLGYDVIVVDSLSHAWFGKGGALEMVDNAVARSKAGNSFAAWREVTPEHNALVDTILQSKAHIIATMRTKTEYVIEEDERGRKVPRKIGLAPVQRDQIEYEFDVVAELDQAHTLSVTKSRIDVIADAVVRRPDAVWFKQIADWLSDGAPVTAPPETLREPEPLAGKTEFNALWAASQAASVDAEGLTRIVNDLLGTSYGSLPDMRGVMTVPQAKQVLEHLKGLSQAAG